MLGESSVEKTGTLDIYFDLSTISKEEINEILEQLSELYKSIGGDDLEISFQEVDELAMSDSGGIQW